MMKEKTDGEKLKIAKEALEFYMKFYTDSRNGGIITTEIKEALKKIK